MRARAQKDEKPFFTDVPCGMTLSTLKRTVLLRGRHWPTMTLSPTLHRKHGEMWAGVLLCRFSYLRGAAQAQHGGPRHQPQAATTQQQRAW